MAQEFVIKSSEIEDKINQLLPSQGGFQAGVDFSASTMVIPIVDLTETAEGGTTRADLQSALSLTSVTAFNVVNSTDTLINTTGYFRIFGANYINVGGNNTIQLTDGTTTKIIYFVNGATASFRDFFDFIVFLPAGNSVTATSTATSNGLVGVTRQIADLAGNLVNPL